MKMGQFQILGGLWRWLHSCQLPRSLRATCQFLCLASLNAGTHQLHRVERGIAKERQPVLDETAVAVLGCNDVRLVAVRLVDHHVHVLERQNALEGQLIDGFLQLDFKDVQDFLATCRYVLTSYCLASQ